MKPYGFNLFGDTCVINISLSDSKTGVLLVSNDPRKQDVKPDCYVGTVEAIGPACKLVKPGDKVVVERWEYSQHDIDDERIWCREIDILILDGGKCAPGVVAMHTFDFKKGDVIIPDTVYKNPSRYYFGKVISSGYQCDPKKVEHVCECEYCVVGKKCWLGLCDHVKEGDFIWVMYMDSYQYRLGDHTFIFRWQPDIIRIKGELEVDETKIIRNNNREVVHG